jgi:hypothetical protein
MPQGMEYSLFLFRQKMAGKKNNGNFNTNNLYMNWTVLILFGIFAVALIIFLIVRNQKDEKVFEDQINSDYHKSKNEEGDAETEPDTR